MWWNVYAPNAARDRFREWSDDFENCFASDAVWAYHAAELQSLYNWSRLRGIPMVLVIFPDMIDIGRFEAGLAKIEAFFEERGVPIINLSEEWKSYDRGYRLSSPFDSHASVPLNREVGEALADLDVLQEPQPHAQLPSLEALLTDAAWRAYQDYLRRDDLFAEDAIVLDPSTFPKRSLEISTFYLNTRILNPLATDAERDEAFDFVRTGERAVIDAELALDDEQHAALDLWRATKEPGHLKDAGIDYLFISSYWEAWLSTEESTTLFNPENYELVADWRTENSATFYQLLRAK